MTHEQHDPASGERYRSLFEEHPHAVFGLDRAGGVTEANTSASRISGYGTDRLLQMNLAELVHADDLERAWTAFGLVLEREPQQVELRIRRLDDAVADLSVTAIPWIVDDEVRGVLGIAEDVTERNRVARELEVTRRLAIEASQAKSEFVARMSHEVRTPLTSILATVELLAESVTASEQHELVSTLQRSGSRLLALVDTVLDFSAAGTVERTPSETFDLHAVIQDAVALVEKRARQKGIRVDLDLHDDVPRWVNDHPTWTSQILINLLSNAVDHTEVGRVHLTVSPTTTARSGPAILYRVADTGIGIDPAHHELVFEPFTQVPGAAVNRGRSGLGLSIVKQLATIGGGTVSLTSSPGKGSTFFVTMPAVPVEPSA